VKPKACLTSLKTDGAVFDSVQPIPLLPLLNTHGLLKDSVQPDKNLADLKTDGLSRMSMKPIWKLTSLKTAGDLLECSLGIDTPSEQVAKHTCDAIAKMKPSIRLHRTYNATGFETRFEAECCNEFRGKLSLITGRRRRIA
jgi:hypothetical protein